MKKSNNVIRGMFSIIFSLALLVLTENSGEGALSFLKRGIGARAAGMGDAFTAISDDASALYWNPAGISQLRKKGIFLEVNRNQEQEINQGFMGYVHSSENYAVGLSINYLEVKGIEKRIDASEKPVGTFKTSDLALGLSLSKKIEPYNIGVTFKYLQEDLDLKTAKTFGLDIGGLYHYNDNRSFGISLSNLGKKIKFINEGCSLPLTLRIGGVWKGDKWTFVGEVDRESSRENNPKFHLGTEWQVIESFAIRAGYKNGELGNWSLGGGFKSNNFRLDYAYVPYSDLGDTHRVSLLWIGEPIPVNTPPRIIDLTPSEQVVYRTNSIDITSNAEDDEDAESKLTCEIQYKTPSGTWTSLPTYYLKTVPNGHWEAKFTPSANAELGKYSLRVRYADTKGLQSDWVEKLNLLTVENNKPIISTECDNFSFKINKGSSTTVDLAKYGIDTEDRDIDLIWKVRSNTVNTDLFTANISNNSNLIITGIQSGEDDITLILTDKDGEQSEKIDVTIKIITFPIEGKVTAVSNNTITIDIGSQDGIEKGMKGRVYYYKEIAGKKRQFNIAQFEIIEVDKNSSKAAIIGPKTENRRC